MTDQDKSPREFWINQYENAVNPVGKHFYGGKTGREEMPYIHVIEYSAYEAQRKSWYEERKLCLREQSRVAKEITDLTYTIQAERETIALQSQIIEELMGALQFIKDLGKYGDTEKLAAEAIDSAQAKLKLIRGEQDEASSNKAEEIK